VSKQEVIANQIVNIIKGDRQPSYKIFFKKAGDVVIDFSKDISFIFVDFIDTDHRSRNEFEKTRLLQRIKIGIGNDDLVKIISIVVSEFTKRFEKNTMDSIAEKLGMLMGKSVVNGVLISDISSFFAKKIVSRFIAGSLITTIFSIGGAMSRAVYGSEELSKKAPEIHAALKESGDLDLFYFLVDDYAGPFVEAMILKNKNPEAWRDIITHVMKGLDKK